MAKNTNVARTLARVDMSLNLARKSACQSCNQPTGDKIAGATSASWSAKKLKPGNTKVPR
jgi:hypothetical protein